MDYFRDKIALVTGGSRGVGLATARELARRGAKVAITARGEERLRRSERELIDAGAHVIAVPGDVGRWEDAQRMVEETLRAFGGLDILVNNAGVSMRGAFADLTPELCRRVVDTNLLGCIYTTRAAAASLTAAGGHVVFVSSIAGLLGLPGASIYCATKAALATLAESLRLELAEAGVHIGVAYLGFTEHDPEKRILAADGSPLPADRPAHHTQDYVARQLLRVIEQRRREAILTGFGKVGSWAHRLSPSLVEKAIRFAKQKNLGLYRDFS
ncbi:MAG: SDR family oxidoreductase [Candidatus Lernaella stagnicola]|nr:SDR family oxidoreductase [Candidatus Lernaella stagnicola]